MLITLNSRSNDVETVLSERFHKVFYWNDVLDEIIDCYNRGIHERT